MVFIHFQADIATAHDAEKYRLGGEKYQAKKYVNPVFFLGGGGIQILKYGFGLSEMNTATFIMFTVLCILKTFNSRNNRKPLGLESFV